MITWFPGAPVKAELLSGVTDIIFPMVRGHMSTDICLFAGVWDREEWRQFGLKPSPHCSLLHHHQWIQEFPRREGAVTRKRLPRVENDSDS